SMPPTLRRWGPPVGNTSQTCTPSMLLPIAGSISIRRSSTDGTSVMRLIGPEVVIVLLLILAPAARTQPSPIGSHKHLIEYGWDRPTPAFAKDHVADMER